MLKFLFKIISYGEISLPFIKFCVMSQYFVKFFRGLEDICLIWLKLLQNFNKYLLNFAYLHRCDGKWTKFVATFVKTLSKIFSKVQEIH